MKKNRKRFAGRLLGAVVTLTAAAMLLGMTAFGAQTTTKKKAVYTYQTEYMSEDYTDNLHIKAEISYRMPVLKGNSAAVRKINAAIRKGYTSQRSSYETLKLYAESDSRSERSYIDGAVYSRKAVGKVTYNKNGIFSIRYEHTWFAGGTSEVWSTGETYSLKTGKKLKVTSFLKGSSKSIRNRISAAYKKAVPYASSYMVKSLKKEKLSKLSFYRKGKRIYVCLPTKYGFTGSGVNLSLKIK